MNWVGWTIASVCISILLFLVIIPFVVLGFWWGMFCFTIEYLYMGFLVWIIGSGEVSYRYVLALPFTNFWEWFTEKTFKTN